MLMVGWTSPYGHNTFFNNKILSFFSPNTAVENQPITAVIMFYKVAHNQSTLSPDKD